MDSIKRMIWRYRNSRQLARVGSAEAGQLTAAVSGGLIDISASRLAEVESTMVMRSLSDLLPASANR